MTPRLVRTLPVVLALVVVASMGAFAAVAVRFGASPASRTQHVMPHPAEADGAGSLNATGLHRHRVAHVQHASRRKNSVAKKRQHPKHHRGAVASRSIVVAAATGDGGRVQHTSRHRSHHHKGTTGSTQEGVAPTHPRPEPSPDPTPTATPTPAHSPSPQPSPCPSPTKGKGHGHGKGHRKGCDDD
ncbi:MAG: hypothetical protein ABR579_03230 [Actinomycetota bacterium]